MADKAKSEVKSGSDVIKSGTYVTQHGGMPPKKNVEAINKENTPKSCKGSTGS